MPRYGPCNSNVGDKAVAFPAALFLKQLCCLRRHIAQSQLFAKGIMASHFLALPRELRDSIYEDIIQDTTAASQTLSDPLDLANLPSGAWRYANGLQSIFRVSRTIRAEVGDYIEHCETYLVSQRYRAFTGTESMTMWRPAHIPSSAQRLYLRLYVAIPRKIARRQIQQSDSFGKESNLFAGLASMLQECVHLRELVLEVAMRRQESIFGQGREATECDEFLQGSAFSELARAAKRLPRLQRFAINGSTGRHFERRKPDQSWTRMCLIPRCVSVCHCCGEHGGITCVEDTCDLVDGLVPRAMNEWLKISHIQLNVCM